MAKNATIHSERISYAGHGATSTGVILCGINYVAGHAVKPAVANFSYAGTPSEFSIRDAIQGAINHGIIFAKAAGNFSNDAFKDRGNRAVDEIVAGAINPTNDTYSYFSAFGSTVNIWAPGENIQAASLSSPGPGGYAFWSGTSFSAPYVAGVAAAYLQLHPTYTPHQVLQDITTNATSGVLLSLPTSLPENNSLLYSFWF